MKKQLYVKVVDGGTRVKMMVGDKITQDATVEDGHAAIIQGVVGELAKGDDIVIYHSPLPHIFAKTMAMQARKQGAKLAYRGI